jgi:hypothetical protein
LNGCGIAAERRHDKANRQAALPTSLFPFYSVNRRKFSPNSCNKINDKQRASFYNLAATFPHGN